MMYKYLLFFLLIGATTLATPPVGEEEDPLAEERRAYARELAKNPAELDKVLHGQPAADQALLLHNLARLLIDQRLFMEGYNILLKINPNHLSAEFKENYKYNLATVYLRWEVPGKAPEQVLMEVWDIGKIHKTSFDSFFELVIPNAHKIPQDKREEVFAIRKKEKHWAEILMQGDQEWNSLYYLLFNKLSDIKYSDVLNNIIQDILNNDPMRKLYIPLYIVSNLFPNHLEMARVSRVQSMATQKQ